MISKVHTNMQIPNLNEIRCLTEYERCVPRRCAFVQNCSIETIFSINKWINNRIPKWRAIDLIKLKHVVYIKRKTVARSCNSCCCCGKATGCFSNMVPDYKYKQYRVKHNLMILWYDMIWYDMIWYDMIWYVCELQLGWHPVAVVQYTFIHKQYIKQHNRHKTINRTTQFTH